MRYLIGIIVLVLSGCAGASEDEALTSGGTQGQDQHLSPVITTHAESGRSAAVSSTQSGSNIRLDEAPPWYNGTLGRWSDLSEETRRDVWAKRLAYEQVVAEATRPAVERSSDRNAAAAGEAILHRVVAEYRLDPYYRTPDFFGRRMVIWLPEAAWAKLSASDKRALEAYMASKYANWGIGVGRQKGRDVLFDRLVVER